VASNKKSAIDSGSILDDFFMYSKYSSAILAKLTEVISNSSFSIIFNNKERGPSNLSILISFII